MPAAAPSPQLRLPKEATLRMEGRTLSHYRVLEKIGEGAVGVIYRARDLRLDRDVALKVLASGLLADDEARRRFRKEAMALSGLNHPNIATVHDFDSSDGVDFLVMEHIPGSSLAERLEAGPIAGPELLPLALQLADALASAHAQGVVHRDLKPANVRITPEGRLKVVDFGLARPLRAGAAAAVTATLTEAGTAVGTLAYMAPEVLGGEPADRSADVFACGVVLYEMATGRHPFPTQSAIALMYSMLNEAPAPPRRLRPELSGDLETLILKAMHRDPARRHPSAAELLADLKALESGGRPRASRAPARGSKKKVRSIAVLPLENLSGDPSQEYFADGMTEALIADLTKIEGLRVISRTSAMRYKGARRPLPEIAAELDVDAVVEGSVIRAGDRVRITAQLIHAASDTHLWADSYDRDLRDVLSLQSEAARAIAQEIRIKLSPRTQARLATARQVNPQAYEAYLRGRHHVGRRTDEAVRRGIEYLRQAIELDPTYALAHAGLADAYNLCGYWTLMAPRDAFPRARAAAQKALEIDPGLGEARVSLGYVHLYHDWDWAASEREFRRALELCPGYPQAHLWYLNLLSARGRFEEAIAEAARARELDPLSLIINNSVGWAYYYKRDYERSIVAMRSGHELDTTFAPSRLWSGYPLMQMGRYREALEEFEAAARHGMHGPLAQGAIAHALALTGETDRAREILRELEDQRRDRYVPAYEIAIVLGALGETDRAFEWLNVALEDRAHWLVFLDVEPRFDSLRSDPRFEEIRRGVGVPVAGDSRP